MNIFIYGGSFDPPHIAHKKIIEDMARKCDKLYLVPSYQSPLKNFLPSKYKHRKAMLDIVIRDFSQNIEILDYEYKNRISYTYETIKYLRNQNPESELSLVIGSDQFNLICSWKKHEYILENTTLIVVSRPGYDYEIKNSSVKFYDEYSIDISSSFIRKNIDSVDGINEMIDSEVLLYIAKNKLYI